MSRCKEENGDLVSLYDLATVDVLVTEDDLVAMGVWVTLRDLAAVGFLVTGLRGWWPGIGSHIECDIVVGEIRAFRTAYLSGEDESPGNDGDSSSL